MEVLGQPDLEHIICWMPHGRAFMVKEPQLFVKDVLPRFFKQSKFMSFTRQLNLWGFKRVTRGRDNGAYYHQLFLRGRTLLCMKMKRQKVNVYGSRLTYPETEPNFYDTSRYRALSNGPDTATAKVWLTPPLSAGSNISSFSFNPTNGIFSYGVPGGTNSRPHSHPARQSNNVLTMHMDHGIFQPALPSESYPTMMYNSSYHPTSVKGSRNHSSIHGMNTHAGMPSIGHMQQSWRGAYLPTVWPDGAPVYSAIPRRTVSRQSEQNHSQYLNTGCEWSTQDFCQHHQHQQYRSRDTGSRIGYL